MSSEPRRQCVVYPKCAKPLEEEIERLRREGGEAAADAVRSARLCEKLEADLVTANEILWDALRQGAFVGNDDAGEFIDNMCMGTYEYLCSYFETRGRLTTENGRIYRVVPETPQKKRPQSAG